jgi:hypothetical protein
MAENNDINLVQQCGTDYSTACGDLPQSLIQMLANCIVGYPCDLAGNIQYRLNLIPIIDDCDDLTDFWTCNNNNLDPERALVENIFALDECGRLGIKVFVNLGEGQ